MTGGIELNQKRACRLFNSMSHSPERFTDLLKRMVLEEIYDLDEGISRFSDALLEAEQQQFKILWDSLLPIDKALLTLISQGEHKGLYSEKYKLQL